MGFGVLGREFEGGVERGANLAGDALLERLGDAQTLAVAAQSERVAVMAVGVVGQGLDRCFGELGGVLVALELLVVVVDQVGGVDAERLDRDRGADRAERFAGVEGGLEVAAMEGAPGVLQGSGERVGVQAFGRGFARGLISAAARLASG